MVCWLPESTCLWWREMIRFVWGTKHSVNRYISRCLCSGDVLLPVFIKKMNERFKGGRCVQDFKMSNFRNITWEIFFFFTVQMVFVSTQKIIYWDSGKRKTPYYYKIRLTCWKFIIKILSFISLFEIKYSQLVCIVWKAILTKLNCLCRK